MSLLEKATLITTPTAHSNGTLHSIKGGAVADFDVVRGSAATRVNAEGLIESVATNIPRIDYTTGEGVVLLEPQSTNLVVNSELNNVENIVVSAVSHTISFYGAGSITLSGAHTATLSGTGANDRVSLTFTPSAGTLVCTDSGSVDMKQVEALSYTTSYIPTNGAIATRLADSVTGAGDATTFNSTEGVLYAEISTLSQTGTFRQINLSNGTASNRVYVSKRASNNVFEFRMENPLGGLNFAFVVDTTSDLVKIAFRYGVNNFGVFINGVNKNVSTTGNTFPSGTLNDLQFSSPLNQPFFGKVKALAVFNEALTDSELECLTKI